MIAEINGCELYYDVEGAGPPLLFLHGLTGRGDDWRFIDEDLGAGSRFITPDLRGHGRSTNPGGTLSHRQIADDVLVLLDALDAPSAKAIGVSQGGNALLHMATRQPSRIEAMVIVSATPYFPEQARALMRLSTVESHSDDEWRVMRARHERGDDQIRELWQHANALAYSYDDMSFTPPHLATIRARTLIVHGDRDPLYPVDMAVALRTSIPDATLWVVPGGGHGPAFQADGPAFARTARAFLELKG
jgi:pimeloyl-ACP methyl ester carboxylesterase